jgi:hypothetical protein
MICSCSRSNERIIRPEDFLRAKALLESVEPKMPRAFMGLGKAKYSEMTAHIFEYLQKVKICSRADILEKYDADMDEYTLQVIMKTLEARKAVKIEYSADRCEFYYTYLERN